MRLENNIQSPAFAFLWVRADISTAASVQGALFWVVVPWNLVEVYRRFESARWIHCQGEKAASTSETSACIYQTTERNNLEDSHFHACRRQSLKSYKACFLVVKSRCSVSWNSVFRIIR
jgi:hypothetical protein